jgi:hypothetical protein
VRTLVRLFVDSTVPMYVARRDHIANPAVRFCEDTSFDTGFDEICGVRRADLT